MYKYISTTVGVEKLHTQNEKRQKLLNFAVEDDTKMMTFYMIYCSPWPRKESYKFLSRMIFSIEKSIGALFNNNNNKKKTGGIKSFSINFSSSFFCRMLVRICTLLLMR